MSDTVEPQETRTSLFWLAYGQVAAMLGAFSLLVFLTHVIEFGLQGVVREAFEGWTGYVRPTIGYPIQWCLDQLPKIRVDSAVPVPLVPFAGTRLEKAALYPAMFAIAENLSRDSASCSSATTVPRMRLGCLVVSAPIVGLFCFMSCPWQDCDHDGDRVSESATG